MLVTLCNTVVVAAPKHGITILPTVPQCGVPDVEIYRRNVHGGGKRGASVSLLCLSVSSAR